MPRRPMDLPFTYVHSGGYTLGPDMESALEPLRAAPPTLLHVSSMATPLPNTAGPAVPTKDDFDRFLTPEEMGERLSTARKFVEGVHKAGVRWVIPYTCNVKLGGEEHGRKGAWRFYDHWEDYESLGIGPRPQADPIDWMARERNGELHYSYEKRHTGFTCYNWFKYTPCLNNPHFNVYQRANVRMIAESGYDGIFVDNNNINCYCPHCEGKFRDSVVGRHSPEQLRTLFGWENAESVRLGWRGNRMDWVKYDPLFRRFVEETLPREEKIRWFGTDEDSAIRLPEAGSGWLWGRSNEFLSWVYVHVSAEERREAWGTDRIDGSWGIRDDRDRALWAETARFWAHSVQENLRNIRSWATEVTGKDFVVVPNWGELLTNQELAFRQDMGHDVEEWAPATDIVFWEDNRDPGKTAVGVFFDYALEYKLASANSVRSGAMAALPGDHATCALAHAEATAHGAAFIQRGAEFPDLREMHNQIVSRHRDWFEGYVSAARVGLMMSFQTYRLGGEEHIHDTFRLFQYLNDQQIPFDLLVDTQLPQADLLRTYSVLICSNLTALSDAATKSLDSFVAQGGILVTCGKFGPTEGFGRVRKPIFVDSAPANVIRFESLRQAIPLGTISREDAIEMVTNIWRYLNWTVTKWPLINAGDYAVKIERFCEPGPLGEAVPNWESYRAVDPFVANGIRVVPYERVDGGMAGMTIHVVNFNVDLTQPVGARKVEDRRNVAIAQRVPDGYRPKRVVRLVDGVETGSVPFSFEEGLFKTTLDHVGGYTLIHIECEKAMELGAG